MLLVALTCPSPAAEDLAGLAICRARDPIGTWATLLDPKTVAAAAFPLHWQWPRRTRAIETADGSLFEADERQLYESLVRAAAQRSLAAR
jgi:hypothetical protein